MVECQGPVHVLTSLEECVCVGYEVDHEVVKLASVTLDEQPPAGTDRMLPQQSQQGKLSNKLLRTTHSQLL